MKINSEENMKFFIEIMVLIGLSTGFSLVLISGVINNI